MFRELFGVGVEDVLSWTIHRYELHRAYADAVLAWRQMKVGG